MIKVMGLQRAREKKGDIKRKEGVGKEKTGKKNTTRA